VFDSVFLGTCFIFKELTSLELTEVNQRRFFDSDGDNLRFLVLGSFLRVVFLEQAPFSIVDIKQM
jgi:hypothetical protein